jgi:hypothetical protein
MGIGVSIFLIAVGAILAFAVNASVSGVDIAVVGYILMLVGILGIVMTVFIFGPRRTTAGRGNVVEEHRVYDDRGV